MYCNNSHQKLTDYISYCQNGVSRTGELPWNRKAITTTTSSSKKKENWVKRLSRKCIIATVVTLAVAVGVLLIKAWPGCFISAAMLLFAIATSAMGLFIQSPGISTEMSKTYGDKSREDFFNHIVDIVLIWEGFWLAAGLACLALPWWAVMIAEMVNIMVLWGVLVNLSEVLG